MDNVYGADIRDFDDVPSYIDIVQFVAPSSDKDIKNITISPIQFATPKIFIQLSESSKIDLGNTCIRLSFRRWELNKHARITGDEIYIDNDTN